MAEIRWLFADVIEARPSLHLAAEISRFLQAELALLCVFAGNTPMSMHLPREQRPPAIPRAPGLLHITWVYII